MVPSTRDHNPKALLITLNELGKKDWPKWDIEEKGPEKTETLQRLLEKLRNAAGHGNLSSEEIRTPETWGTFGSPLATVLSVTLLGTPKSTGKTSTLFASCSLNT